MNNATQQTQTQQSQITIQGIVEKYPLIFKTSTTVSNKNDLGLSIFVQTDWLPEIDKMIGKIYDVVKEQNLFNFKIVKISELYGTLRVYTQNSTEQIDDIIRVAEYTIGS